MITSIAAIDDRRGLATDTGIPWNLPTDKRFFRDRTSEGIILMGAGTYREFAAPLHGRTNYVVTHDTSPLKPGFEAVHDLPAFLAAHNGEQINDIGGAGLFAQTIAYADELLLTRVQGDFHCTKFFPEFENAFELADSAEPRTENGITFYFETWRRRPD